MNQDINQEKKSFSTSSLIIVIVLSLTFSFLGSTAAQIVFTNQAAIAGNETSQLPQKSVEPHAYIEESQTIDAIKKVSPAVVSIIATQDLKIYYNRNDRERFFSPFEDFPQFYFQEPDFEPDSNKDNGDSEDTRDYEIRKERVSGGSGFIITPEGMVLTNRHVVSENNVDYSIITQDGTEYDAEVVSVDTLNDLAVLQMIKKGEIEKAKAERTKITGLPVVELGDSDLLEIGQRVLAIGYALGEYENTVTSGIISGKSRDIVAGGGLDQPEQLSGLLQTDAAINFGNSGGPLVNLAGQVIGVNVAIDYSGRGIGFAIPMNDVKPVLESIQKYGRIIRPSLGVRHLILNPELARELDLDVDHGALVSSSLDLELNSLDLELNNEKDEDVEPAVVPGSPAEKAGIKEDDVILSVNGKNITTDYTLQDAIREQKPGDEITLDVWRDGKTMTVKATLGETK